MASLWIPVARGLFFMAGLGLASMPALGQLPLPDSSTAAPAPNPLTDATATPGKVLLFNLEARFAKDVSERGGKAVVDWFAPDGVLLGNGQPPVVGKVAIAKTMTWTPTQYQLTWTPTDAMMGPSGDMGYTWGHFEGHSRDANGNPVNNTGRYMTIWRKEPDGEWKVVLDAGANEPPGSADCCRLPGH
ncbi:MAG TPA: nuclear transport factor 2 family protein [Terracidiphilus sp.]|nr:nuclear transport factor 2 family protein [Terracidiphilus sp.]